MELLGIVLVVLIVGLIVWLITDDQPERPKQSEQVVQAELRGLRAANRLNVAFWRAREELEAEADRHRKGGDRPW